MLYLSARNEKSSSGPLPRKYRLEKHESISFLFTFKSCNEQYRQPLKNIAIPTSFTYKVTISQSLRVLEYILREFGFYKKFCWHDSILINLRI